MDNQNRPTTFDDFKSPLYVMAKPAGAVCNLDCKYCYYTEKAHIYDHGSHGQNMTDATLERFVREYIQAQSMDQVLFTWHGGEPMLRPLHFYKRALELQRYYGYGKYISNCIQTNGTLINDDWAKFFKDNNWLVGVSIDGPEHMHDAYRKTKNGGPTFSQVMRGIELLDKYGVEWNAMAVVNAINADRPEEFYEFFKSINCHYIQFTPIVERIRRHADGRHLATPDDTGCELSDMSVTAEQWGDFLCKIFDIWVKKDVGEYFIQLFDATLANWVGVEPGICTLSQSCGHASIIEHNGDVYSCDHFVFPEYRLGNINNKTLSELMYSERQLKFGAKKMMNLPNQCRQCRYFRLCHGECPKNRIITTASGEPGLNYLCNGYYRFFEHSEPYMRFMRDQLEKGLSPAEVMKIQNL